VYRLHSPGLKYRMRDLNTFSIYNDRPVEWTQNKHGLLFMYLFHAVCYPVYVTPTELLLNILSLRWTQRPLTLS
jgi:hypothetical protein